MRKVDRLPDLEPVRQIVLKTLPELGFDAAKPADVSETELLRDEDHPGRRFQYDAIRAVWFLDSPVVHFFSQDGQFLKAVAVEPAFKSRQAAA